MQKILSNKNIGFNFITFGRTERIKLPLGLVSITNITWAHRDSVIHTMNLHSGIAMPTNKLISDPNYLLKLVDDFMIIDVYLRKHLYMLINHLPETGNVLRA